MTIVEDRNTTDPALLGNIQPNAWEHLRDGAGMLHIGPEAARQQTRSAREEPAEMRGRFAVLQEQAASYWQGRNHVAPARAPNQGAVATADSAERRPEFNPGMPFVPYPRSGAR